MTDYLTRLAQTAYAPGPSITPRLPALFELVAGIVLPVDAPETTGLPGPTPLPAPDGDVRLMLPSPTIAPAPRAAATPPPNPSLRRADLISGPLHAPNAPPVAPQPGSPAPIPVITRTPPEPSQPQPGGMLSSMTRTPPAMPFSPRLSHTARPDPARPVISQPALSPGQAPAQTRMQPVLPPEPGADSRREPPETAPVGHSSTQSAPTVHITIGRIEVRAARSGLPPKSAAPRQNDSPPALSLDAYLKQRDEGKR